MKSKLKNWILVVSILPLVTGFSCHRKMMYTPDITLKKDGQPCISIPLHEVNFLNKNKQFDIITADVFQVGVGTLWETKYYDLSKPYKIQAGKCIGFEYHFQKNIVYSIGFISAASGSKEFENGKQKIWSRDLRITTNTDGSAKLLLDLEARENN